jgi:hypothetical protein
MSLKAMNVSKLRALRQEVEATIHAKVAERRQEIESELSRLARLEGGRVKVVKARAKVMVARKVGKKLAEPLTANKPKATTPKQRTKTSKARKTRKAANPVAAVLSILPTVEHAEALPVETLLVEAAPIEAAPVEALPVTSANANVAPPDVSAAA